MESELQTLETIKSCALLFPGYDSLRSGIAKELHDQHRTVQEYFEEAAHITTLNVTRLLFNASESELRSLPDAYALLFLVQASVVSYLRFKEIEITSVGGCGLGAHGALFACGAFNFPDGLYMSSKWATLYQDLLHEKNFKKVKVDGITLAKLKKLIAKHDTSLAISEKITESEFVVAGARSIVEEVEDQLTLDGIAHTELVLEGGLYADLAPDAYANFKIHLEKVTFNDPQVTCFRPDVSKDFKSAQEVKEFIAHQPFLFQDHAQLIERYAESEILVIPFADQELLEQVHTRYPEKNIITLL